MKRIEIVLNVGMVVLFLIAFVIWFGYQVGQQEFKNFLETYIVPDGAITYWQLAIAKIYSALIYSGLVLFIVRGQIKRKEFWIRLRTQIGIRNKIAYGFAVILILSSSHFSYRGKVEKVRHF